MNERMIHRIRLIAAWEMRRTWGRKNRATHLYMGLRRLANWVEDIGHLRRPRWEIYD